MSLKAKIEAVIYASEEPVTLGQLLGLLGVEAQAELDAADQRQGQLALSEGSAAGAREGAEAGDQEVFAAEIPMRDGDLPDAFVAGLLGIDTPVPAEPAALATDEALRPERGPEETEAGGEDSGEAGVREPMAVAEPMVGEPTGSEPTVSEPAGSEPTAGELRVRERRLREYMRSVLDRLVTEYRSGDRGLEIREIAGGYRFATKPEYHDAVRGFVRLLKPPLKLSLQALETLAVVAYKQPVTAPEVSEVRGVDSGGVLGSLMARKLVATAGRKQVIGRPILYKTTKEFLLRFGLKDVSDLPSIEEFERMASDMNVALQEEIPMPDETVVPVGTPVESGRLPTAAVERAVGLAAAREAEPSRGTHMAQADGDPNPSTPSADEVSAEHLTPAPDGPSEFTGNDSVPPAQNTTTDGRISGMPPLYDTPTDEMTDSPANDAAVRSAEEQGDV